MTKNLPQKALPAGVARGQFGPPGVLALMAFLAGEYHLSTRQIQRLLHAVFHLESDLGTVSQAQEPVSAAVAGVGGRPGGGAPSGGGQCG
ncbi:MAG: hypothetical protein U1F76_01845 [Candidatus Competibacteraceae bacterium]